jgi:hypothetical protein
MPTSGFYFKTSDFKYRLQTSTVPLAHYPKRESQFRIAGAAFCPERMRFSLEFART